jgi:hypothetical protein
LTAAGDERGWISLASCTKPVYRATGSARIPHGSRSNISSMDALAIALGIAMFAILFGLIYAIDRV